MNRAKSIIKRLGWGLLAVLALCQFIRPGHTNPPAAPGRDLSASAFAPSAKVAALLRGACYDCHSYETKWPWYGQIAPVSWWLADHIKDARARLNFSDWPVDNPARAKKKLERISENVESGDMPLPSYTWMHPAARLSAADKKLLADWADESADNIKLPAPAASPENK